MWGRAEGYVEDDVGGQSTMEGDVIGCGFGVVGNDEVVGTIEKGDGGVLGCELGVKVRRFTKEKGKGVDDWGGASVSICFFYNLTSNAIVGGEHKRNKGENVQCPN